MDTEKSDLIICWYMDLEGRLEHLLATVPYRSDTMNLFFPPLASIFLDACSILDAVFREEYSGTVKRSDLTFKDYPAEYEPRLGLGDCRTVLLQYPTTYLQPFNSWTRPAGSSKSLDWWQDHNTLKHDRIAHSDKATLQNCVASLCALHQAMSQLKCFFSAAKRHH